jgi:hypothetical protein
MDIFLDEIITDEYVVKSSRLLADPGRQSCQSTQEECLYVPPETSRSRSVPDKAVTGQVDFSPIPYGTPDLNLLQPRPSEHFSDCRGERSAERTISACKTPARRL